MKKEEENQSGYQPNEVYTDLEHNESHCGWDASYEKVMPSVLPEVDDKYEELRNKREAAELTTKYLSSQTDRVKPEVVKEYLETFYNFLNSN